MMEDKLKRYEKIEFLGEGQVTTALHILLKTFLIKRLVSNHVLWKDCGCLHER